MTSDTHAVVIARQGHARTSLVALLATIPHITAVTTCDYLQIALNLPANYVPHIVFYETYYPSAITAEAMNRLKQRWSTARLVVLAEQTGMAKSGGAIGADLLLTKEIQAGEFLRLIYTLTGKNPANQSFL
jgi:DNA-binding NarL/FixJ family response regulator